MALGVPIVSTAVMGTAAVLRDANGALVSPQDVGTFTDTVAQLLRDPELRASLSAAGPRDVRVWCSEALMRQTVDLYTTLLPGAGRAGRAGHSTVNSPVA